MISFKQLERIYANDSSRLKFITALQHFLSNKKDTISSTILTEVPVYGGKPVDLYELFHQVDRREGFERVNNLNRWQEVVEAMKLQTTALALRDCYIKYLRLFEEAIRKKAQQHQQQPNSGSISRPQDQNNLGSIPRPPSRPLEPPPPPSIDQSSMPPQKRPRPELVPNIPSGGVNPQVPVSNIYRPAIPRAQTLPTSHHPHPSHPHPVHPPPPPAITMISPNLSTSTSNSGSGGSIMVSSGHIKTAINSLLSCDQNSIKQGLNYLMQLSLEGDNSRNILYVDKYPTLITALGTLLDTINPFTKILFTLTSQELLEPSFNISQYLLSNTDKYSLYWNEKNPLDEDNVLQVKRNTLPP
jgi:hypothetical protein